MTARTRTLMEWVGAAIGAGVFAAGVTYGATRSTIDALRADKLDAKRFELDSAFRAGQQTTITETLQRLELAQQETNDRLREIVCPPGARGCR